MADSGAVYVFTFDGTRWDNSGFIKAENADGILKDVANPSTVLRDGDRFGASVVLSGDGQWLAVGAPHEDSVTVGFDGDMTNSGGGETPGLINTGAVYLYRKIENGWSFYRYVKPANIPAGGTQPGPGETDLKFGTGIALNRDAATMVVGAPGYKAVATDNEANAGVIFIY